MQGEVHASMDEIRTQGQRWLFRNMRWGGFGVVAGFLGSILVSLDTLYAIAFFLNAPSASSLTWFRVWFPTNLDFGQTLITSWSLFALSIFGPKLVMKRISITIAKEEDPKNVSVKFFRVR